MPETMNAEPSILRELYCQVRTIEPLRPDISRVWLQIPENCPLSWRPGQYLMLVLEGAEYPFSIANAPGIPTDGVLELHVRHTDDNAASLEIMAALREGGAIHVRAPGGERFIGENLPEQPVWFVCGSTGFAPAKAMIEALLSRGFRREIRLYWGARTQSDLYLPDLPKQWAEQGRIHYQPVLSEEAPTANMRAGLVHEAVLQDLETPGEPLFHVGGSPAMVWAVFDALRAAGVPEAHIHSDVLDYAPREGN